MKGQVAIVTGGAKGIGRYVAHGYAREGAKVVLADIEAPRLEQTAREVRELGAECLPVVTDVRDEAAWQALIDRTVAEFGPIDVLVNDAAIVPHFAWGIPHWPNIRDMDASNWNRVIETNLGGTFLGTKHALRHMEPRRAGHIINLYGGGGVTSFGSCAYVVTKEAIRTFTRWVAEEARAANVCVVCISPDVAIATEDASEEARARLPGPDSLGNRFILAAQAGMDLTGETLSLQDGRLVVLPYAERSPS